MLHELKTWPSEFEPTRVGLKTHEVRRRDRNFQAGDVLRLREWDPARDPDFRYTGREIRVRVTYVSMPGTFGLPDDMCVMSIHLLIETGSRPAQAVPVRG